LLKPIIINEPSATLSITPSLTDNPAPGNPAEALFDIGFVGAVPTVENHGAVAQIGVGGRQTIEADRTL